MSTATLILGNSGTGKSTSLRNLDPAKTAKLYRAADLPLILSALVKHTSKAWGLRFLRQLERKP